MQELTLSGEYDGTRDGTFFEQLGTVKMRNHRLHAALIRYESMQAVNRKLLGSRSAIAVGVDHAIDHDLGKARMHFPIDFPQVGVGEVQSGARQNEPPVR